MPVERGYESQVMPRAGAMPALTRPEDYGAGLADAVGQVAQDVHRREIRSYQLDRKEASDQWLADFSHRFAQQRTVDDEQRRQLRANAGPGGAGHVDAVGKSLDQARSALLADAPDQETLQAAQRQWDTYASATLSAEGDFQEGQRIGKQIADGINADNLSVNRIRQGMDPDAYSTELKVQHDAIFAEQGLPDSEKEKRWQRYQQQAGVAFVNRVTDTNPVAARAMLDNGAFNFLPPNVLEQLRNGTDVEIRRQAAALHQAAAEQKSQVNEAVSTVTEKNSQGIDVSADAQALIPRLEALGEGAKVEKMKGIVRDGNFAKVYGGMTPLQREARIGELAGKAHLSEDEQAELQYGREKGPSLDSQFRSDPVRFAIEHGATKPPALEQGLAARRDWARSVSGAYGIPMPIFTANEAAGLRAQVAQSPAGQIAVADELAVLGGRDAINAARQVAPGDAMLQQLVLLGDNGRRAFQQGAEVRKGDRSVIDGDAGTQALDQFNGTVGNAMQLFPESQRNAAFEVARNVYASWAGRNGHPELKQGNFAPFIETGLGRKVGEWRGQKVLLPEGYDEDRFSRAIGAYKPTAGVTAPVFADGSPMTGDQLRRFTPVQRPDGRFEFHAPGGRQVMAKNGTVFLLGLPGAGR